MFRPVRKGRGKGEEHVLATAEQEEHHHARDLMGTGRRSQNHGGVHDVTIRPSITLLHMHGHRRLQLSSSILPPLLRDSGLTPQVP